jgi:hypothetical protein
VPSIGVEHVRGEVYSKGKRREVLPYSKAPSLEDHNAALAIEDIALNRTSNTRLEGLRDSDGKLLGNRLPMTLSDCSSTALWIAPAEPAIKGLPRRRNEKDKVHVPGLEMLPSVEIADYLFRHFVSVPISAPIRRINKLRPLGTLFS